MSARVQWVDYAKGIVLHKLLGIDAVPFHLALGTLCGIALPLLALRLMERYGLSFLLAWPRGRS